MIIWLVTVLMNRVAAVVPSVGDIDPAGWLDCFDDMFARVVAPAFFRREPRLRAEAYLLGLVSGLERKSGWRDLGSYSLSVDHVPVAFRCGQDRCAGPRSVPWMSD